MRWSRHLQPWRHTDPLLPHVTVGLEGCQSAFNALNAVRTTQYFGTGQPPVFMSLASWDQIANLQSDNAATRDDMALFGAHTFLRELNAQSPLIALENFTQRAESVLRRRVPPHARLLVGHENRGVAPALLRPPVAGVADDAAAHPVADAVLYIPQYGTISSLNVVTALGIGLFYAFLDAHCPEARTLPSEQLAEDVDVALRDAVRRYQRCFNADLPHTDDPAPSRLDARPVHPHYYTKTEADIRAAHGAYRRLLLDFSNAGRAAPRSRFGLSVLYENEYDQRNLGGLVRCANAFLVDAVCYVGHRKYNVVGAIGSHHYTPPCHISCDTALRAEVEAACGGPCRWWLLDCGHAGLYEAAPSPGPHTGDQARSNEQRKASRLALARYSSAESLAWYAAQWACATRRVISLSEDEATLRRALGDDGVLLLVPQEGKLPDMRLLSHCEGILTVLPTTAQRRATPGLPSQVASGIALQRLSAVLHPRLQVL